MRESPSIAPGSDRDIYLVLDDLGRAGRAWRETDLEDSDREMLNADLLEDQYKNPLRVIAFNTAEGWSRDASEDVAREIQQRCADRMIEVPATLQAFVGRFAAPGEVRSPLPKRAD